MKIIYLHQYFSTPDMVGGTRSFEMAKRLVNKGHEVHVITSWREEDDKVGWFQSEEHGIQVHWLPVVYSNKLSYVQRIIAFVRFALSSSIKAASIKSELIFATSTPLTIAIPAVFASKFQKVPLVFEVRDLWPELPIAMGVLNNKISIYLAKILEKWAYKNSKAIIALSPGMKDGILKQSYPADKVAVIPNGCDNDLFEVGIHQGMNFRSRREWLKERPLLVYAGTFGIINGVGYLVELAKELLTKSPEMRILLVGGGRELENVIQMAKELGVFEVNLFVEPEISKNQVPELLSAATISTALFIDQPEMRANSANKFFDCLAAGKPILINYGGWMDDLVKGAECGINGWKMSISDVADSVVELINDKGLLMAYGSNAKKLAETQFNRDYLAKQFEGVLRYSTGELDVLPAELTNEHYI
jgi:glycosyltransferase involved in cell wall biosynthesis